jgi:uncharacterized protein (DUF608 family)
LGALILLGRKREYLKKHKRMKELSRFLVALLMCCTCVNVQAQTDFRSQQIKILKHYDADHLHNIALPLGGIGTGTVSLSGKGELKDWEIMNVPAKGFSTVRDGNDAPFFAIYVKEEIEPAITKGLLGPIEKTDYEQSMGVPVNHHGLPRFRNASFETTYPFGIVNLTDVKMPVDVKLVGYNPFIPGDADASGIPIAVLEYEVTNTTDDDLDVSISGNMRNFIGNDGKEHHEDWQYPYIPTGAKNNKNTFKETNKFSGIYMYSEGVDKEHQAWGTIALTVPKEKNSKVTYRTSSIENHWGNALLDFWDDFSDDGLLTEKLQSVDDDPMASLAVSKIVKAGQREKFTFYLTWHFPNRHAWASSKVGNYYCTLYDDAWHVMEKEIDRLPELTQKSIDFVNAYVASSYPEVVKEAALFNLSTLRTQTVFRTEDGRMFGWEGLMDRFGSCQGTCTHVWNYEQATAFLFNDLSRTIREAEFGYATRANGMMTYRIHLPLKREAVGGGHAAADGQMGTIIKFYRDWQLSGDTEFLKKHWPDVKLALSFAWIQNGWDGDVDGVMEGPQHNTMDVEYFGPNPQMQIYYLGALKAGEKMALAMDDEKFAKKCNKLFKQGSKWTDENLFNGEYYIHQVVPPAEPDSIPYGLVVGMGSRQFDNPDFQLATGCLVDQLVGQYMAHVAGLGYLVNKDNVKKTLQSIRKYNKRENFHEHFNNMRSFVLGDEKGLLMASWPKGGRPVKPFPYWSEVMTGFEYCAAVGMLYEGMEAEGLEVIKNIRDRYDGKKRSPFNEAECGHHYARAMAAWAAIVSLSDFQYSGVDKSIQFTNQPGNYFWSNGSTWGMCEVTDNGNAYEVKLTPMFGDIELKSFTLGANKKQFGNDVLIKENQSKQFVFAK